ncbi:hypothetical protein SS54_24750 [Enterobacter hormaechei subsp. xiangfangensis]|nr:hypothetical protein SS54_24750 [Enterobacter hormaechei subsp. xiangfangensis]KTH51637.1 hypothetical protein ASV23_17285 [Enterobacter hormaechei subsp. steigerwaltii]KVJ62241.1 hypothetical protein AWS28_01290 [Enterobacter hormaechei subsp. steigerwaltii]KVJ67087.1 hypothetical protein AWS27_20290 [Enterobacter hormaechei subsp. steigerwaltii]KZQ17420.1 hypothetical protein A3N39_03465 [Enterobacter hormaechei subsp. steigerwaltii]
MPATVIQVHIVARPLLLLAGIILQNQTGQIKTTVIRDHIVARPLFLLAGIILPSQTEQTKTTVTLTPENVMHLSPPDMIILISKRF